MNTMEIFMTESDLNQKNKLTMSFDELLATKSWYATDLLIDVSQCESIDFVAYYFCVHDKKFQSLEEAISFEAELEIAAARKKIIQMEEEIKIQEAIIVKAIKGPIKEYKKKLARESQKNNSRPKRSGAKTVAGKRFVQAWVSSLMQVLEVRSPSRLGKLIQKYDEDERDWVNATDEKNWRRWFDGDNIPTVNNFDKLLNATIKDGKYAGANLLTIPTQPTGNSLLNLLRYVNGSVYNYPHFPKVK